MQGVAEGLDVQLGSIAFADILQYVAISFKAFAIQFTLGNGKHLRLKVDTYLLGVVKRTVPGERGIKFHCANRWIRVALAICDVP